jgi:hypothetical protein
MRRVWGVGAVAIYRLLQEAAFEPEDIERLAAAYEEALRRLQLIDRGDPVTEIVARRIIDIARTGMKEPHEICDRAIEQLGLSRSA